MNARDEILANIARGRTSAASSPYRRRFSVEDAHARFIAKAEDAFVRIHFAAREEDVPQCVADLLRSNEENTSLHIPPSSPLAALDWVKTGVTVSFEPPSGDSTALSTADHAIAETGTLVFFSGPEKPASWHFRPGREIVLLRRDRIAAQLETVLAGLGAMPATVNLVTGPSRTADIEQTIEHGAHGPRALDVILIG